MLDSIYHMTVTLKSLFNLVFFHKNAKILLKIRDVITAVNK